MRRKVHHEMWPRKARIGFNDGVTIGIRIVVVIEIDDASRDGRYYCRADIPISPNCNNQSLRPSRAFDNCPVDPGHEGLEKQRNLIATSTLLDVRWWKQRSNH